MAPEWLQALMKSKLSEMIGRPDAWCHTIKKKEEVTCNRVNAGSGLGSFVFFVGATSLAETRGLWHQGLSLIVFHWFIHVFQPSHPKRENCLLPNSCFDTGVWNLKWGVVPSSQDTLTGVKCNSWMSVVWMHEFFGWYIQNSIFPPPGGKSLGGKSQKIFENFRFYLVMLRWF